jgi:multisubunit Na+/H+ antiporter MnhG subunit
MKILGYLIAVIGAIGVLLRTEMVKKLIPLTLPAITQTTYFMIGSIIIVLIGIALTFMNGRGMNTSRSGGEVPIYSGNQIVGYRRI